jgi:hypothetical protein
MWTLIVSWQPIFSESVRHLRQHHWNKKWQCDATVRKYHDPCRQNDYLFIYYSIHVWFKSVRSLTQIRIKKIYHQHARGLVDMFFKRQSVYLWVQPVLLFSPTCSCIRMRQTSYIGLLKKNEKKLAQIFNLTLRYILIGATSSGISIKWEIYTPYAGADRMLLHTNGKFTMGKLKSSLLS